MTRGAAKQGVAMWQHDVMSERTQVRCHSSACPTPVPTIPAAFCMQGGGRVEHSRGDLWVLCARRDFGGAGGGGAPQYVGESLWHAPSADGMLEVRTHFFCLFTFILLEWHRNGASWSTAGGSLILRIFSATHPASPVSRLVTRRSCRSSMASCPCPRHPPTHKAAVGGATGGRASRAGASGGSTTRLHVDHRPTSRSRAPTCSSCYWYTMPFLQSCTIQLPVPSI